MYHLAFATAVILLAVVVQSYFHTHELNKLFDSLEANHGCDHDWNETQHDNFDELNKKLDVLLLATDLVDAKSDILTRLAIKTGECVAEGTILNAEFVQKVTHFFDDVDTDLDSLGPEAPVPYLTVVEPVSDERNWLNEYYSWGIIPGYGEN